MVPFLSFFNNRYSRVNSSSSSAVCTARLCRAVFFLKMGAAAFGSFFGSGLGCCFCASFLAWRFFFRCFSRDLSLIRHACKLVVNFYFAISHRTRNIKMVSLITETYVRSCNTKFIKHLVYKFEKLNSVYGLRPDYIAKFHKPKFTNCVAQSVNLQSQCNLFVPFHNSHTFTRLFQCMN